MSCMYAAATSTSRSAAGTAARSPAQGDHSLRMSPAPAERRELEPGFACRPRNDIHRRPTLSPGGPINRYTECRAPPGSARPAAASTGASSARRARPARPSAPPSTRCSAWAPCDGRAAKTHGELLPHLAVARVEHDVPWVRVDPDQAGDLAVDTALLLRLADGGLARSIHRNPSRRPATPSCRCPSAGSQYPALIVHNGDVDRRNQAVRRRRVGIVEVVDPPPHRLDARQLLRR